MARTLLIDAIRKARTDKDTGPGLLAQRRVLTHTSNKVVGGTAYEWHVAFDDRPDRFMTLISDHDVRGQSDNEIADLILSCWDTDWDDIQQHPHVGNYELGSSDFVQRNMQQRPPRRP